MKRAIRIASVNHNGQPACGRAFMGLRRSEDGRYRWFGRERGEDTEISGKTVGAAIVAAETAWRGTEWDFRLGR